MVEKKTYKSSLWGSEMMEKVQIAYILVKKNLIW